MIRACCYSPPTSSCTFGIPDALWIGMLATVGGFLNGASYVRLHSLFTAAMTGNFFSLPAAILEGNRVLCRGIVVLAFYLGAFIAAMLSDTIRGVALKWPKKSDGANASLKIDNLVGLVLFSVEVVLLALVWILGSTWSKEIEKSSSANEWQCIVIGSIMAFCASWQTVALTETKTYQKWPSSVVVTMNTVTLGVQTQKFFSSHFALWMAIRSRSKDTGHPPIEDCEVNSEASTERKDMPECKEAGVARKAREEFGKVFLAILGFFCGAILGIKTMTEISWHCLFVPIVIIVIILVDTFQNRH